jgi:uncharacterized protein YciI
VAHYALICTIDATRLEVFGRLRAEHYRYLIDHRKSIAFGGPARVAEGGRPETMIIILDVPSMADAERFVANEPYSSHGGFTEVVVRPWSQVIPEAEPGTLERTYCEEMAKRTGDK